MIGKPLLKVACHADVENTSLSFFFSSRRRHTRYIGDWSSDVCSSDLLRPLEMTMMICSIPADTASSTAYWMMGRSTSGIISLGIAFEAGRKRVPNPAAGRTALRTRTMSGALLGLWGRHSGRRTHHPRPTRGSGGPHHGTTEYTNSPPRLRPRAEALAPHPRSQWAGSGPGGATLQSAADAEIVRPHPPRAEPRSADGTYQPAASPQPARRTGARGPRDRLRREPRSGVSGRDPDARAAQGDRARLRSARPHSRRRDRVL